MCKVLWLKKVEFFAWDVKVCELPEQLKSIERWGSFEFHRGNNCVPNRRRRVLSLFPSHRRTDNESLSLNFPSAETRAMKEKDDAVGCFLRKTAKALVHCSSIGGNGKILWSSNLYQKIINAIVSPRRPVVTGKVSLKHSFHSLSLLLSF